MERTIVPESKAPICSNCKAELKQGEAVGLNWTLGSNREPTVVLVMCCHCGSVLGVVPIK